MSDRYAREYVCPDPDEHGEIVFVPGILRYHWREGRYEWTAMADIPACPICGIEIVHDTDERQPELEIVLRHRDRSLRGRPSAESEAPQ